MLANHPKRINFSSTSDTFGFRENPQVGKSVWITLSSDGSGFLTHFIGVPPENAQLGWRILDKIGAYNVIDEYSILGKEWKYNDTYPIRR